jgi:hypothetical protein
MIWHPKIEFTPGQTVYRCDLSANAAAPIVLDYRWTGETVNGHPGDQAVWCESLSAGEKVYCQRCALFPTPALALFAAARQLAQRAEDHRFLAELHAAEARREM